MLSLPYKTSAVITLLTGKYREKGTDPLRWANLAVSSSYIHPSVYIFH